jgi:hypothetical protein
MTQNIRVSSNIKKLEIAIPTTFWIYIQLQELRRRCCKLWLFQSIKKNSKRTRLGTCGEVKFYNAGVVNHDRRIGSWYVVSHERDDQLIPVNKVVEKKEKKEKEEYNAGSLRGMFAVFWILFKVVKQKYSWPPHVQWWPRLLSISSCTQALSAVAHRSRHSLSDAFHFCIPAANVCSYHKCWQVSLV